MANGRFHRQKAATGTGEVFLCFIYSYFPAMCWRPNASPTPVYMGIHRARGACMYTAVSFNELPCPAQPRESLAGFLLVHGALFLSVSLSLCFFHYHWDVNVTAPMHCTALHVTVHACFFRYLHHPHRTRYLLMRRTGVGGRRTARGENENCMVYKRYGTRRGEATSIFVLDAYSCTIGRTVLTTV